MAFPSVYEMMNPLTTVRKQHFWDYFSGANITAPTTTATYAPTSGATDTDIGTVFMAGEGVITTSSALYNKYVIEANFMVFKTSGTTGTITAVQVDENGDVVHEFWSKNIADLGTSNYVMSNEVSIPSPIQMKQWHTLGIISTHDVKFGIKISEAWDGTNSGRVYYSNYNTLGSTSNSPTRGYNTTYDMAFLFKLSSTPIGDRWNITNFNGVTGATAMADEVNGGVKLTTSGNRSALQFNNIRPFSNAGSEIIWIVKQAGSGANGAVGLANNSNGFFNSGVHVDFPTSGNSNFYTLNNAGAGSYTSTGKNVSESFDYHTYKMTCSASSQTCSIDGVTVATRDNNQDPDEKMQPVATVYNSSTTLHLQYCEAYNT